MKKVLLLILLNVLTFYSFGQTVYLADTAFYTDRGSGGAEASCIYTGGTFYGFAMQKSNSAWIADKFVVPAGALWFFDTVILYGYQTGTTVNSTITGVYLTIYNGNGPGSGGSMIWGDSTTNLLVKTGFTGIYKTDTGVTSVSRPIMYLKLHLNNMPRLGGGTYWLVWSADGSSSFTGPWCPPKVNPGRVNPSGQAGKNRVAFVWQDATDNGPLVGFNKIIKTKFATSVTNVTGIASCTLNQNNPNPFKGKTQISFTLNRAGHVSLTVINITGQTIATLINEQLAIGDHDVTFNANELPAGTYFYQLQTDEDLVTKKMTITK